MSAETILAQYREASAAARTEQAVRRARVLAHDDLRLRLTERPLSYTRPEQWSGYVPPKTCSPECPPRNSDWTDPDRVKPPRDDCDHHPHLSPANTSPIRRALVEICAEALRRELEAADGGQELHADPAEPVAG